MEHSCADCGRSFTPFNEPFRNGRFFKPRCARCRALRGTMSSKTRTARRMAVERALLGTRIPREAARG